MGIDSSKKSVKTALAPYEASYRHFQVKPKLKIPQFSEAWVFSLIARALQKDNSEGAHQRAANRYTAMAHVIESCVSIRLVRDQNRI